jgi:hypothetical protein
MVQQETDEREEERQVWRMQRKLDRHLCKRGIHGGLPILFLGDDFEVAEGRSSRLGLLKEVVTELVKEDETEAAKGEPSEAAPETDWHILKPVIVQKKLSGKIQAMEIDSVS